MSDHRGPLPVVSAGALDVLSILVFVAIGRSSHADGVTVSGMASTSWPFLMGGVAGWMAAMAWRRPFVVIPTGVTIWLVCVVGGMGLRVVAGQGTAPAFIAVALAFLGFELLGWRAVVRTRSLRRQA